MSERVADLLAAYDRERSAYNAFVTRLEDLLTTLLRETGNRVHSVTGRVKDRESFEKKIARPDESYATLAAVTDLAGLRITTYLADDVDKVGAILRSEFAIDEANSVDKRLILDPDRFGYLSLHYVVRLLPARAQLTEYRKYSMPAEIQVRSILQHAWAEIEHDLGYKSAVEVPRHVRRRFSRIAGLLELADQEFVSIREELATYEQEVSQQIVVAPQAVALDRASLTAFVEDNPVVRHLDEYLADLMGAELAGDDTEYSVVAKWRELGILTIGALDTTLTSHEGTIRTFAKFWLSRDSKSKRSYTSIYHGISLFYLRYVVLAERADRELAVRLLSNIGSEKLVDELFSAYAHVTG
jgi:ppGpp synthetase/RelA/SpoT-type nucleotidyltranferase